MEQRTQQPPAEQRAPQQFSGLTRGLILLGVAAAGFILWKTSVVWLAGLLAVTFAVVLHRAAAWVGERMRLSYGWTLTGLLLVLVGVAMGAVMVMGPPILEQLNELSRQLPAAIDSLRAWLEGRGWGQTLLENVRRWQSNADAQPVLARITAVFSSVTGAGAGMLLMLAMTLFLAATPGVYFRGALQLVPRHREARAERLIRDVARALCWWVLGRAMSMTIVGLFTGLGLWLIGVPLPWVLGLIAGLLSFVPNIGPVVAAVPGLLLAAPEGMSMVVWALGVYVGVQLVESNVLTPMIERYAVQVPPALLIVVQMMMGVLFGVMGLLVATPLMVTVIVAVQELYIRDQLHREVNVLGRHGAGTGG